MEGMVFVVKVFIVNALKNAFTIKIDAHDCDRNAAFSGLQSVQKETN